MSIGIKTPIPAEDCPPSNQAGHSPASGTYTKSGGCPPQAQKATLALDAFIHGPTNRVDSVTFVLCQCNYSCFVRICSMDVDPDALHTTAS